MTVTRRAPSTTTIYATLALLCLIWGSTWLVIREGLRDLPPLTGAAVRFSGAAVLFVGVAALLKRREGGSRPPLWMSVTMGLLNFAVPYGLVYHAETVIPSSLTSVLWAVFPILVAISGHFLLPDETLRPSQALGFVTGFLGVGLLFLTDLRAMGPEAVGMGALVLLSPTSAAIANLLIKRHGAGVSSVRLTRNGMAVGAVGLGVAALLTEDPAQAVWSRSAILSVVYLTVFGTVVTFGLYFWLLRFASAQRLSLIAYVTPVIAVLLGWLVGEEPIGTTTLSGAGLVLAGIWVAARRRGGAARGIR